MSQFNHVMLANDQATALGGNLFRKQLLRFGEWIHPNNPKRKLKITKELVGKLVENFKAGILDKVPVPDTHTRSAVANTGYVVGLEETPDGLDGILKIDDDTAAEKIRKGLIPGMSVSFTENYTEKESGKNIGAVLFHAALVDNPYLKGMRDFQPIAMSDENDEGNEHIPFVASEGGQTMTKEQLIAALKEEHGLDVTALGEQAGKVSGLTKDLETAQGTLDTIQKVVGEKVELSDSVGLVEGVKKLAEATKEKDAENVKLGERIAALELEGRKRDAKDSVKSLIVDGKLAPTQAEEFESLYLADKDLFGKIAGKLTKTVDLSERGLSIEQIPGQEIDTDAEIERISKANGFAK